MGNQVKNVRMSLQARRVLEALRENPAEEPAQLATAGVSVARKILLRVVANALLSHFSRRAVICALLAGFQVFVFGYLGHLPNSQSAIILASPMIEANSRQGSHAVLHQEDET
jgi:hypothetical protein